MKAIILHRAAADNAGEFVDAGSELPVGDGEREISAARAAELVQAGGAVPQGKDPLDHDGDGKKVGSLPKAGA